MVLTYFYRMEENPNSNQSDENKAGNEERYI